MIYIYIYYGYLVDILLSQKHPHPPRRRGGAARHGAGVAAGGFDAAPGRGRSLGRVGGLGVEPGGGGGVG